MTIHNLFYRDNFVRSFSSRALALDFADICCDNCPRLNISDFWVSSSSLDDMKI